MVIIIILLTMNDSDFPLVNAYFCVQYMICQNNMLRNIASNINVNMKAKSLQIDYRTCGNSQGEEKSMISHISAGTNSQL